MSRDLSYDGLRGWLLIIIACNHLFGSFVTQFTRTPLGFVSAAEGFVFYPGLLLIWYMVGWQTIAPSCGVKCGGVVW
ncbi:hypothetical protein AC626_05670 [Pseudoalteromonas rubra]|uniref:Uncharacterized protein n=1 Tax=Pseudoalteromonas rubra TaxID=43658 RepID=A0A0L0EV04_9GAMM|nr:hypothetical protein AC626_05670 [Pseudoalteromonas rubra]